MAYFVLADGVGFFGFAKAAEHRLLDGAEDVLIARAAAEMAGEQLAQLVVGVFLAGVDDLGRRQDEAR